jgi:hypothetical protein
MEATGSCGENEKIKGFLVFMWLRNWPIILDWPLSNSQNGNDQGQQLVLLVNLDERLLLVNGKRNNKVVIG